MPAMSIVLATDSWDTIRPVIDCLTEQELGTRIEIVVVLASRKSKPEIGESSPAEVRIVEVGSLFPVSAARAAGVRATRAPLVFLGETHSFPRPGMFDALIEAHASEWTVVVPAFENQNPDGAVSWAGFLTGYAAWTAGRSAGELDNAPIFNASYRRSFLVGLGAELGRALSTGEDMIGVLRAAGHRVAFDPAARIGHANISFCGTWLRQRLVAGRVIAGTRSAGWPRARRIAYALAAPLIPVVLLARGRAGISRTFRRERIPLLTLPALLAGSFMQAAGEFTGYALGRSVRALERYDDYEIHQLKNVRKPVCSSQDASRAEAPSRRWPSNHFHPP